MAKSLSLKRLQISKANTTMVAAIGGAAFVVVFSLVASNALWNKRNFQAKLIAEKEVAVAQLEENLNTVDELSVAYQAFVDTPENVIGGNSEGSGDKDGDNAKIVLDALPSKYDFPALATSLEKILKPNEVTAIGGEDQEVAQINEQPDASPVEIPFDISASGDLSSIKSVLETFQRSIRPINVISMSLSGSNANLELTIDAKTYYQPEKPFSVQKKVIR